MTRTVAALVLLVPLAGCNSAQLRFSTLRQGTTVPDIQQIQVLENLARVAANPGALPFFTLLSSGTTNITDRGTAMFDFKAIPHAYTEGKYGFDAERTITGNWSLYPINDPNRLAAMRAACLIALGRPDLLDRMDLCRLRDLLALNYGETCGVPDPLQVIPTGWLRTGGAHPGKHCEPYVARYRYQGCDLYAWVPPENLKAFADFSLIFLDLATLHGPPVRDIPHLPEGEPAEHAEKRKHDAEAVKSLTSARVRQEEVMKRNKTELNLLDEAITSIPIPEEGDFLEWGASAARINALGAKRDALMKEAIEPLQAEMDATRRTLDTLQNTISTSALLDLQRQNFRTELLRQEAQAQATAQPARNLGPMINPGLFFVPRP